MNDMDGLRHWRADLARPVRRIRGVASALDERGDEMSEGIAGKVFIGEGFLMDVHTGAEARTETARLNQRYTPMNVLKPFESIEDLQAFIDERIRAVLEEDARAIRERKEFQPTKQAGTCCACLMAGDDMAWVGNRLAHKTDECRRKAAEMPAVREHRG